MVAMISVGSVVSSMMQQQRASAIADEIFEISSPETCWPTVVLVAQVHIQPMQTPTIANVFVKGVAAKSETLQNYPVLGTAVTSSNTFTASAKNSHHYQHRQTGTIGRRITQ